MLSNQALRRDAETGHYSHLLAEQEVSLVGRPVRGRRIFHFPEDFRTTPVILPSLESDIRAGFDLILDQAGVRPNIAAEVDDMAMLRILALRIKAVALVPKVVVQDELRAGLLVEPVPTVCNQGKVLRNHPEPRVPQPSGQGTDHPRQPERLKCRGGQWRLVRCR